MKDILVLSLMIKYRELLESGISYEDLKEFISYDKELAKDKKAASRLLDSKKDLSIDTALELYETEQKETVIQTQNDYGKHISALDLAYETIHHEEEESFKLMLKNTNLD